jgi:hypothetical protein
MSYKVLLFSGLLGGTVFAAPIQITINLAGGNFDRGVTTSGTDTGTGFTTASAACSGTGCASLSSISSLNSLLASFTVPSGSSNGSGSVLTGSLFQSTNLSGFTFTGESVFNQNSSFTENVSAAAVLGTTVPLTGTLAVTWSGNSSVSARSATGTITLNGDVATTPEPSTAVLLSLPFIGLMMRKKYRGQ